MFQCSNERMESVTWSWVSMSQSPRLNISSIGFNSVSLKEKCGNSTWNITDIWTLWNITDIGRKSVATQPEILQIFEIFGWCTPCWFEIKTKSISKCNIKSFIFPRNIHKDKNLIPKRLRTQANTKTLHKTDITELTRFLITSVRIWW